MIKHGRLENGRGRRNTVERSVDFSVFMFNASREGDGTMLFVGSAIGFWR
jgi:hypothetical protein